MSYLWHLFQYRKIWFVYRCFYKIYCLHNWTIWLKLTQNYIINIQCRLSELCLFAHIIWTIFSLKWCFRVCILFSVIVHKVLNNVIILDTYNKYNRLLHIQHLLITKFQKASCIKGLLLLSLQFFFFITGRNERHKMATF